jgi:hypothetical protein
MKYQFFLKEWASLICNNTTLHMPLTIHLDVKVDYVYFSILTASLHNKHKKRDWSALSELIEATTEFHVKLISSIFCGIIPSSPLKAYRSFGGIYGLHLQGLRISQAKIQHEASSIIWLTLQPWRWSWRAPPKCQLTFNGLRDVVLICQKTAIFATTSAITASPSC